MLVGVFIQVTQTHLFARQFAAEIHAVVTAQVSLVTLQILRKNHFPTMKVASLTEILLECFLLWQLPHTLSAQMAQLPVVTSQSPSSSPTSSTNPTLSSSSSPTVSFPTFSSFPSLRPSHQPSSVPIPSTLSPTLSRAVTTTPAPVAPTTLANICTSPDHTFTVKVNLFAGERGTYTLTSSE